MVNQSMEETEIFHSLLQSTTYYQFEKKLNALKEQAEREKYFHLFVQAYLAINPFYQVHAIWPLQTIPTSIFNRLEIASKDLKKITAHGVFETYAQDLQVYLNVYHANHQKVVWPEMTSFFNSPMQAFAKVLITNTHDFPPAFSKLNGCYAIRRNDFEALETIDFENMLRWHQGEALIKQQLTPFPHQQEAVDNIIQALRHDNRLKLIMACGTGKSFVPLWVAEKKKYQRIIVFVPTLTLLHQFVHTWLKNTTWERIHCMVICSDPTVAFVAEDRWLALPSEMDFPVTTEVGEVKKFLNKSFSGVQLLFCTYQSVPILMQAAKHHEFDLGVFDEAHKTAGINHEFSAALNDDNIKIKKRLFMTATPRHVDIRKKQEEEGALIYSMDNPQLYGSEIYRLPFADAIEREIICPYKIIISAVTTDDLNRDRLAQGITYVNDKKTSAYQKAIQVALKKALTTYDIRKVLTFHRTIKQAKEFATKGAKGFQQIFPELKTFHINGNLPASKRKKILNQFSKSSHAILTNAKCLTEGVDIPTIDMVAFLSINRSKIDIVQAAGRAMRKSQGKHVGYIFVPLFLQQAQDETLEEAFERTDFDAVWSILNAISEHDEGLALTIRDIQIEKGQYGDFTRTKLAKYIELIGAELTLKRLEKTIITRCIDRLSSSFDQMFGELLAFKEKFGHCNVSKYYKENPTLAGWVNTRRQDYKKKRLSQDRIERLEKIGFVWNARESRWDLRYQELIEFKSKHGHCNVPEEHQSLCSWITSQRAKYKIKSLHPTKIKLLENIGFIWQPKATTWENRYHELIEYKKIHGDCDVALHSKDNPKLGNWIAGQRASYKSGRLAKRKIEKLKEIGFIWIRSIPTWEPNFQALIEFKKIHGHCNVPQRYKENPTLATWVNTQRQDYKNKRLSAERIQRLNLIGFDWDLLDSSWKSNYQALVSLKEKNGHCNLSISYKENPKLARWGSTQRRDYKKKRLSEEKILKLEAIGFKWRISKS